MMNDIMINPCVDIAFKKIFGVEENKDLLLSLVNSIVSDHDQVDQIELLNPYNERNHPQDKLSILDIKARNKRDGTYFLIEMQLADETDYHQRSLYSWARVYSSQLNAGNDYKDLKKTIAIHLLNFTFIVYDGEKGWNAENLKKYHHCFTLQDKVTKVEVFTDLKIHIIELSKFDGAKDRDLALLLTKVKDMLDTWLAVFTNFSLLDAEKLPKKLDLPEIKKALTVMREMRLSRNERYVYEAHLDFLRIEVSAFRKQLEKGMRRRNTEIVRNLLAKGMDMQFITEVTGLSEAEIKKLL